MKRALVLCVAMSGCAAVQVLELDPLKAPAPKAAGCKVELFLHRVPERAHTVFGKIEFQQKTKTTYNGASQQNSHAEILKALNAKACEMGADGLIIDDPDYDKPDPTLLGGEPKIEASLVKFDAGG